MHEADYQHRVAGRDQAGLNIQGAKATSGTELDPAPRGGSCQVRGMPVVKAAKAMKPVRTNRKVGFQPPEVIQVESWK